MSGWLLDTNVLSELRRKQPAPAVIDFVTAQPLHQLHVSTVTFAEIRYGIELLADAERRAALTRWLDHHLRPLFEGRILLVLRFSEQALSSQSVQTFAIVAARVAGQLGRETFDHRNRIVFQLALRDKYRAVQRYAPSISEGNGDASALSGGRDASDSTHLPASGAGKRFRPCCSQP